MYSWPERRVLIRGIGLFFASVISIQSAMATPADKPCPADLKKRFEQQASTILPWSSDTLGKQWVERPKYFIVIGVTEISVPPGGNKQADYALTDANKVSAALCDLGYAPVPDAPEKGILSGKNATRDNILATLEKTAQIGSNNPLLILYYSGHGIPGASPDDLYLPFYDSKSLTIVQSQSLKDLLYKLRSNYAGDLIVVLDACFSGTATVGKVLTSVDDFSKTAILTSSSLDEYSYPITIDSQKQSAFTHFLLQALQTGGDLHDGITTLGDAHLSVTANLLNQFSDPALTSEMRLQGPMTPSITGVGIPRMVAYSREHIDNATTTRRVVYTIAPQLISAYNLNNSDSQNLPGEIVLLSGGTKIATFSVRVGPGTLRSLVPTEMADSGTVIDTLHLDSLAVAKGSTFEATDISTTKSLSGGEHVINKNRYVFFDPSELKRQTIIIHGKDTGVI